MPGFGCGIWLLFARRQRMLPDVARAENLIRGCDLQGCPPGRLAVRAPIMCLRFVFLLIMRASSWLQLSRREEAWKTAEILILRHQIAVLQRQQPRPEPGLGGPGIARDPARGATERPPPRAATASHPGHDPALAPRHRPPPLGLWGSSIRPRGLTCGWGGDLPGGYAAGSYWLIKPPRI